MISTPKKLLKIVNDYTEKRTYYFKTLQIYYNKPYIRIWSIRNKVLKECYRETIDSKLINSDFVYTQIGGWVMKYRPSYSYYTYLPELYNEMLSYNGSMPLISNFINLCDYSLLTKIKGLEYIKGIYLPYNEIAFIKKWLEYPDLELYCKNGLKYVWSDKRFLTLKNEKRKNFLKWIRENQRYVELDQPNYKTIKHCVDSKISYKEYIREQDFWHFKIRLAGVLEDSLMESSFNYVYKLGKFLLNVDLYRDYINACKELKRDLSQNCVLYPKDLHKEHDEVIDQVNIIKNKDVDKKMKKISSKAVIVKSKDLIIKVPDSTKELINVSNKLHNCVGRLDYNKRMSECKDLIILVCDLDGNYIECCELLPKEKRYCIQQLYGDHNQYSDRHKECESLVNKFIKSNKIITI